VRGLFGATSKITVFWVGQKDFLVQVRLRITKTEKIRKDDK
jgi:hypothetical protein